MKPTKKQILFFLIFLINSVPHLLYADGTPDKNNKAILLNEITLWSNFKSYNNSPLRLKSVDEKLILPNSAGRTFPELIRDLPGVYSTSESGSYGDAKLNIRGYKQENIAVMLNGIPITGLVSGSMFWNNWMGLSDATAHIQVQKGIGGSMISDNSVGGTVNIITKSPSELPSVHLGFSITESGVKKSSLEIGSGKLRNGWAFSLMGSYVCGNGWVEMTDVNSWAYMASVSKQINKKHSLLFTALGSPEKHEQRNTRISYAEIEKYGVGYNKNWGYFYDENGNRKARTIAENNYFKPYFTLHHSYKTSICGGRVPFQLNSAIYFTTASGGGIWAESKGKRIISYQKEGHIDWGSVVADNKGVSTGLPGISSDAAKGSALNILSDYRAGHHQYGAKSSASFEFGKSVSLEAGLHFLHYRTWENERITDLLGGAYWYEDYERNSLKGAAGRDPIKKVGDYIRTDNGRYSNYGTLYFSSDIKPVENLLVTLGGSLNLSALRRWDKYNYSDNYKSEWVRSCGGAVKLGALYKLGRQHSIYANAGFNSRIPYYNVYFASGNNEVSRGVKNERNILSEIGYRFVYDRGAVEVNGYYTFWKNKTLMSNAYKPLDEEAYKFMINGLNARHYGVEFEAYHNFSKWLYAMVYASHGVWRWRNDVHATLYDPYSGAEVSKVNVYSNNLPVGDAPQSQVGGCIRISPFKTLLDDSRNLATSALSSLEITANWQYNTRYWADFEPSSRTNADDSKDPYRIPSYNLVNLQASIDLYSNRGSGLCLDKIKFFFNLNNLFNELYVERGKDGSAHDAASFAGYWGQRRNINCGLRVSF